MREGKGGSNVAQVAPAYTRHTVTVKTKGQVKGHILLKGLMRSKNTSGYFSFYVDNISLKHIPLGIFQKFPLNPIK